MYGKIFASMYSGSLRGYNEAQSVLVFLVANADSKGVADFHPMAIGDATGLEPEEVMQGLEILLREDDQSRSKEFGGRRIVPLNELDESRGSDWGWWIVNYEHYRSLTDADTMREKTAARVRAHRMRSKGHLIPMGTQTCLPHCPICNPVTPVTVGNGRERVVTPRNYKEKEKEKEKESSTQSSEVFESSSLSRLPTHAQSAVALQLESPPSQDSMTEEEAFEQVFWPEYPRRVGKAEALREFLAIFKKMPDAEADVLFDRLMSGLRRDVANEWKGRELDKIPHARTWLHNRRWEA